jgi:3-hydroxyacyl-[acyl-carrier-protein] dehydratase
MLAGDFFNVTAVKGSDGRISAGLHINAGHHIFEGHFPGQPVVPGVCMMQMVKELLERQLQRSLQLQSADSLKFLSIIDPLCTPALQADVLYRYNNAGQIKVTASLFDDTTTYFKMSAQLTILEN